MSEQRPGQIPGDVIMRLGQKKHRLFNRDGNDLKMEMTITLKEALLGFTKTITHMDEHTVEISRKRITKPFFVKTIKGEGMPIHQFPSEHGGGGGHRRRRCDLCRFGLSRAYLSCVL